MFQLLLTRFLWGKDSIQGNGNLVVEKRESREAIIKGENVYNSAERWGRLIFMKHILMYSSNSCFEFCILQLKKKSPLKKKTQVFVLRVCFQFVHSSENFCMDFGVSPWNVPGAWVRHEHSLRTFYRNSALLWNLLALWMMPLRNGIVSLLSERSTVIPKQQEEAEKHLLPADANEDRLGNTSTFLGMFGTRMLVLCQSEQETGEAGQMFLLRSQPAWRVQTWP